MNTINKLFRKYLWNSLKILFLFLVINCVGGIVFFSIIKMHTVDSDKEMKAIAKSIHQNREGEILMDKNAQKLLENKGSWAMVLDETGNVIWDYHLPKKLPRKYSVSDVAVFSRWYLKEYPVLIQKVSFGLLVVGYQPNDMFGISLVKFYYVTDSGFLMAAVVGSVLLIVMNIVMVILLFRRNTKEVEKEIVPIMNGIEDISKGKDVELSTEGELANINQKLNYASQYIRKKDRTRAEWINGISHDVRTPLSLIMGYAGKMKEDNQVSVTIQEQAEIILGQAEKIKRLITDLNLVSKLENSMQPLRKEKVDLLELGRQVLSDFLNNGMAEKYEIEYDISNVSQEFLYMEGDMGLLRRMLENLIQNSISHNTDGCQITLMIQENKDTFTIIISDNGLGVLPEKLAQLNQGVGSGSDYMENGEAAHGYGLKLVRQIVKAHQGEILFRDSKEKGFCTEIHFYSSFD